jgi:hypothetical protein
MASKLDRFNQSSFEAADCERVLSPAGQQEFSGRAKETS